MPGEAVSPKLWLIALGLVEMLKLLLFPDTEVVQRSTFYIRVAFAVLVLQRQSTQDMGNSRQTITYHNTFLYIFERDLSHDGLTDRMSSKKP